MKKLGRKVLYTVTILGMLTMLTLSSGIFVSSTPKSVQNQDISLVTISATAENNVLRWNTTWGGTKIEWGNGIAVDANGYLYCVGKASSFGAGLDDFALVKFAPNGTKLWNTTWGGANYDIGCRVAVDAYGSIYCVGATKSFGAGNGDLALVKFAPNGTKLWNTTWGCTSFDAGGYVAVDANGSICCLGYTFNLGKNNYNFALVKFAPNGMKLWNTTWGGTGHEEGRGLVLDANGSLYCGGYTSSSGAGNFDFALVKFNSTGTKLWNTTWGGAGADYCEDIAIDTNGFLYCGGYTNSFGAGNFDFAVAKFAPNGTKLWNCTWGGVSDEQVWGIAVDVSGSVYCTGTTYSFGAGLFDLALVKFATTGTKLWNITWGTAGADYGNDAVVDASGFVYCIGATNSFGAGDIDFALLKFGYLPEEPGGIPGFELVYLLIGLLTLIFLVQRRRPYSTLS